MANLSKLKREKMLSFLEKLKNGLSDEISLIALNEIQNQLTEKKYGLIWEEHTEKVDDLLVNKIPILKEDSDRVYQSSISADYNFIIQGDNLQALYLLQKTHKGKIDCIYLDPPYNNRARSWKYNNDYVEQLDLFKHSKWLSMIKNRLKLAKSLLNPKNSVLIITIDDKEVSNLGCLLEEMFPTSKITLVSSVINPAGKAKKGGVDFSRTDEYIFFVQIGESIVLPEIRETSKTPIVWETFRRHSLENGRGKHGHGASGPNQFYPIYVNIKTKKIVKIGDPIAENVDRFSVEKIKDCIAVFPVRDDGTEMNWGAVKESALDKLSKGYLKIGKYSPDKFQQFSIQYLTSGTIKDIESGKVIVEGKDLDGCLIGYYPEGKAKVPTTNWNKPSHNATNYGTDLLKLMLGKIAFNYPKSLYAVYDAIKLFISNNPKAIVLDFFAGSGTTMHAVHLLNKSDNGDRKCILVTNNELSYFEEEQLKEKGLTEEDDEWDELGIAKSVTWPRCLAAIKGKDINNKQIKGEYGVETEEYKRYFEKNDNKILYKKEKIQLYPELSKFKLQDGFQENLKFFKCDWIDRRPENQLLSNTLTLHVKSLIELKTHQLIDGSKYALIINKRDLKKYIDDEKNYNSIKKIWINSNLILNSVELSKIRKKEWKYIPLEFFSAEIKEAGE